MRKEHGKSQAVMAHKDNIPAVKDMPEQERRTAVWEKRIVLPMKDWLLSD
jgi:hypothetical protein